MGLFLKLLAWVIVGSIGAALLGTLASILAVSGYSNVDLPATSNAFSLGAGIVAVLGLGVSLLAWRPQVAAGRLFVLDAAIAVGYPIAAFAVPLFTGHPLLTDASLASASAVAPRAAVPLINAVLGLGLFGVVGLALTALFLLFAVLLLRSAGNPDDA